MALREMTEEKLKNFPKHIQFIGSPYRFKQKKKMIKKIKQFFNKINPFKQDNNSGDLADKDFEILNDEMEDYSDRQLLLKHLRRIRQQRLRKDEITENNEDNPFSKFSAEDFEKLGEEMASKKQGMQETEITFMPTYKQNAKKSNTK
jgi:hypothetical protein